MRDSERSGSAELGAPVQPLRIELALGLLCTIGYAGLLLWSFLGEDDGSHDGGLAAVGLVVAAIVVMQTFLSVVASYAAAIGSRSARVWLVFPLLGALLALQVLCAASFE